MFDLSEFDYMDEEEGKVLEEVKSELIEEEIQWLIFLLYYDQILIILFYIMNFDCE